MSLVRKSSRFRGQTACSLRSIDVFFLFSFPFLLLAFLNNKSKRLLQCVFSVSYPSFFWLLLSSLFPVQKCTRCFGSLPVGSMVVTCPKLSTTRLGGHFHSSCFRCIVCRFLLVDLVHCVFNGRIYCERHYAETQNERCRACDEVIRFLNPFSRFFRFAFEIKSYTRQTQNTKTGLKSCQSWLGPLESKQTHSHTSIAS